MSFVGKLQDSDALYFRALVAKSFFNDIEIVGHCKSESNRLMTSALEAFGTGGWIDFGDSEEVLCFSAIRSSREPGEYTFVGNADLLDYVKDDLLRLLSQLGCDIEIEGNTLKIYSSGWKVQGDAIHLPFNKSDIMA